ncbi:hypothetical protein [Geodermatophilus africanus]|uniref:hypothetical protein n=1 Tax=Geodermatophilus africanus TaxID=1137993 RepID=UPI003CC79FF9
MHRWLVDDDHEVFLDQHLSDGLLVGEEWQQRLHERLRWADAILCILTSPTSPRCSAEPGFAHAAAGCCGAHQTGSAASAAQLRPYVNMTTDPAASRAEAAETLLRIDAAGQYRQLNFPSGRWAEMTTPRTMPRCGLISNRPRRRPRGRTLGPLCKADPRRARHQPPEEPAGPGSLHRPTHPRNLQVSAGGSGWGSDPGVVPLARLGGRPPGGTDG